MMALADISPVDPYIQYVSVSLVVEWQIPILLARVRFPDGEDFLPAGCPT